jgi:hypothetical protein
MSTYASACNPKAHFTNFYICMYVCMYVCMYAYIYIYIYMVCIYACIYLYTCTYCTYIHTHIHTYIHTYIHTQMHTVFSPCGHVMYGFLKYFEEGGSRKHVRKYKHMFRSAVRTYSQNCGFSARSCAQDQTRGLKLYKHTHAYIHVLHFRRTVAAAMYSDAAYVHTRSHTHTYTWFRRTVLAVTCSDAAYVHTRSHIHIYLILQDCGCCDIFRYCNCGAEGKRPALCLSGVFCKLYRIQKIAVFVCISVCMCCIYMYVCAYL